MKEHITIGMDLGNKKHAVCALDAKGTILFRTEVAVLQGRALLRACTNGLDSAGSNVL